ncbi:MAG: hypothetical protein LBU18_00165, partial [Treponema sp.]|nr:hypothetical protein [Treponema sp.]
MGAVRLVQAGLGFDENACIYYDLEIMLAYIARRLLLIIPTLWAIITINFFIVQIAPGGPVDQ